MTASQFVIIKSRMEPKILLLNYSQHDADIIQRETKLKVIRGYISEVDGYTQERDGRELPNVHYYAPEPYYECAAVFALLPASNDVAAEFSRKAELLTHDDAKSLREYWGSKLLTIFVGDTNYKSLYTFGVPLRLHKSKGNDTETRLCFRDKHEFYELGSAVASQIAMPPARYITEMLTPRDRYDDIGHQYYEFGTRMQPWLVNANRDMLACALSHQFDDYEGTEPGAIILPTPKKLSTTTIKLMEFFGEHYAIYTPGGDWHESETFYPQQALKQLNTEIETIKTKAIIEVKDRQQKVIAHKTKWEFLPKLVTDQGDQLVDAVFRTLTEVVGLQVTKSDDEKKAEAIDDLLVEIGDQKIVIEVKGTTSSSPRLDYPLQALTHVIRRGYTGNVATGLIVNHDMNKDPKLRKLAYNDKEKSRLIDGLYYIDTRVLLEISQAVIDGKLSAVAAQQALFGKLGRVVYPTNNQGGAQ